MSGFRAEVNEAYFHNLTIQVLTDGMEKKRQEIYQKIRENQKKNVIDYPVEKAIGDAIIYHDRCSLLAGLEFSAESVRRADDPGLNKVNQILGTLQQTQHQMNRIAALTSNNSPEVVLPVLAFNVAKATASILKGELGKLKALSVPQAPGASEAKKEKLERLTEEKKNLEETVGPQLDAWKRNDLSEAKGQEMENIQTELQTAQTQLYTSVIANDSAEIQAAKLALRAKQNEAKEVRLQYRKLTDDIRVRLDEVKRVIKKVELESGLK